MIKEKQKDHEHSNNPIKVLAGVLISGLGGAVAMLLLAPKSGKNSRVDIQNKSLELRDQTTEMMKDALEQGRSNVNKFSQNSREIINNLSASSQEVPLEKFDHLSQASKDAKNSEHLRL